MDERLAARTAVFGTLVVILAGVAIWFVHSALQRGGLNNNNVTLTANARHTVKVGDVSAGKRAAAQEWLDNAVRLSGAGDHKPFLHDMANGRVALCVGSFSSSDSPGARDLLERLRAYKLGGQRVFRSAVIWSYQPQAGR